MRAFRGRFTTPLWVVVLLVLLAPPAFAYRHHTSRIRYQEYSEAVFEQARREQKPVFLLISAVWCYWCKYFDEHALETPEVSEYLNRHFINVFVDSDRRMDLTRRYARGWPMTVIFDPEARVRLSFPGALTKDDFLSAVRRVESEIRTDLAKARPAAPRDSPPAALGPLSVSHGTYREFLNGALRVLDERLDSEYGGFGDGRKFPYGRWLAYLLERPEVVKNPQRLAAVEKTLEAILTGLYDRTDGGFFRYAERRDWSEAHTEKMLYVNAELIAAFDRAYRITRKSRYKEAADGAIGYLLRTLYDQEAGGFYGSQSADPAFYRLAPEERKKVAGPPVNRDKVTSWNAQAVLALLQVGQSTGRQDLKEIAFRSLDFVRRSLLTEKGVYHIYEAKTGRGYLRGQLEANAWAARAFLEGYRASGRPHYRQAAQEILKYLVAELYDDKRGAFVEERNPDGQTSRPESMKFQSGIHEIPLDANGLTADTFALSHQLLGRPDYLDIGRRVLAALGGEARAIFVDQGEIASVAKVADATFYLRAYERLVKKS